MVMKSEMTKKPSFWGWIKILRNTTDDDLREICGTDCALYLVFIRLVAQCFLLLNVNNLLICVPMYLTGDPLPNDDWKNAT